MLLAGLLSGRNMFEELLYHEVHPERNQDLGSGKEEAVQNQGEVSSS